jgi:uncharacterized protein YcaQ
MMRRITNLQARRLLLYLQGLSEAPDKRLTRQTLYDLIVRMGFVQVDSIRTVERAHHLTLMSRNTRYHPDMLQALLENDKHLFENWTHDAAIIPTQWYPYWQPRFAHARQRIVQSKHWMGRLGPDAEQVLDRVRQRVRDQGPVMARDLTEKRPPGIGVWWGWGPSKTALEYLWRTGELAICGRVNFHKVYDLSERVIPEAYHRQMSSEKAYIDWACQTALDRLGCATPSELAAFWGGVRLSDAHAWCQRHVGKTIQRVVVDSADGSAPRQAYARHDIDGLLQELPAPPSRIRFLSPFDPVIRDRKRALRLFNFDYRFEAFVPAPQRQYGYYVLPILERDRFIGRIDLKCDRLAKTLVVNGLWLEPGVRQSNTRNEQIAKELERYRAFVGADKVVHPQVSWNI